MFVAPGSVPEFGQKLTREAVQRVAANWWRLLVNGLALIVAGVLIFSISWSIRSLATFIGALFILQGVTYALTTGIEARAQQANVVTGLLSIAAGIVIIAWPGPGIVVLAIFLGAWLIVLGTLTISGAFMLGLLGPVGVVAAADHGPARDPAGRARPRQPWGNTGRAHHRGRDLGGRRRRDAHRVGLRDQAAPRRGRQGLDRAGPERHDGGRQAPRGEARRSGMTRARFL